MNLNSKRNWLVILLGTMVITVGCQSVKGKINNSNDEINVNEQQSSNISDENGKGVALKDSKSEVNEIVGEDNIEVDTEYGTSATTVGCQSSKGKLNNSNDEINMNEQQSITISKENGKFYFNGITLKDSKSEVIEILGGDCIEVDDHGTGATLILEYDNLLIFFNGELVVYEIIIRSFDEPYYEALFDSFIKDGVVYNSGEDKYNLNSARFFYSKDSSQLVTAKYDPNRNLFVFFMHADNNFFDAFEVGAYEQVTK